MARQILTSFLSISNVKFSKKLVDFKTILAFVFLLKLFDKVTEKFSNVVAFLMFRGYFGSFDAFAVLLAAMSEFAIGTCDHMEPETISISDVLASVNTQLPTMREFRESFVFPHPNTCNLLCSFSFDVSPSDGVFQNRSSFPGGENERSSDDEEEDPFKILNYESLLALKYGIHSVVRRIFQCFLGVV